jgi:hypothetical protein
MRKLKGVESIAVNTISGSVLLRYDLDTIDPEMLIAALVHVLDLKEEVEKSPQSWLSKEIGEITESVNRASKNW